MESTLENMDMALDNMCGDVVSNSVSNLTFHADVYGVLLNNIHRKSFFNMPDKVGTRKILARQNEELSDLIQNVQNSIFSSLNNNQAEEAYTQVLILDKLEITSKDISSLLTRSCD